jgi:hypothetical protein
LKKYHNSAIKTTDDLFAAAVYVAEARRRLIRTSHRFPDGTAKDKASLLTSSLQQAFTVIENWRRGEIDRKPDGIDSDLCSIRGLR